MNRKNCKNCGDKFEVRETGANKYCSVQCANRDINPKQPKKKVELQCDYCGDTFEKFKSQVNKTNNYCSRACCSYDHNNGKDPSKWITLICEECGEEFEEYKNTVEKQNIRCCSLECGHKMRVRAGNVPARKVEVDPEVCDYCGNEISRSQILAARTRRKRGELNNIFCSTKCHHLFQRKYDSNLTKDEYRKMRSKLDVKKLCDFYVIDLLRKSAKISIDKNDIPKELIGLKRLNIKRKRTIKKLNQKQK